MALDKELKTLGKKQYHIHLKPGDIGKYVLLPGDPARSDRVAKYLDNAEFVAENREHRTFTGYYKGVKISVTSTGMGCPSATIAAEELMNIGAECLIRIGSSAALQDDIKIGDLMISTGSMKNEGTSRFYVPDCFPSVPDFDLTREIIDTEFEMDALKGYDAELQNEQTDDMEWDTSAGSEWQEGETDGLRTYVCKSCGGEIVGDANMAATSCPFCDNPIVMMGQFAGALKPDLVIPFKLDKKAAKEGLKKHLTGKRLLPKIFKDQNHIDEIKGIYVPFWLFDTNVDAAVRYRATKVRMWSDSDYDYTETSHFMVHRGGSIGFENVPVDGSTKMADDLMESIEPFNISGAVDFQTAYLAGYLADKYDVTAEQSIERANKRVKHSTEEAFAETVKGYATVTTDNSSVQFHGGKAKYALYPVWLLNTTWNGNKYTFAMNGQTGKFVGDLPVDKGAAARWTVMLAAVFSVVTYGAAWLLHLIGLF